MTTVEIVFYGLGALAVATSLLVITSRNPIASLLFLVASFFCLAGIFVTLEAHFLAAIQILVYAGAILVLFLFVIMLLNLGLGDPWFRVTRPLAFALAGAGALAFIGLLFFSFRGVDEGQVVAVEAAAQTSIDVAPADGEVVRPAAGRGAPLDEVGADASGLGGRFDPRTGTTEAVGLVLFRDFLLPFEVTSLLLLVAMVGAVMLAKRDR